MADSIVGCVQSIRLLGNELRLAKRIDVHSIAAIGLRLYKTHIGHREDRLDLPARFVPKLGPALGMRGVPDFESIVRAYIADDMPCG